MSQTADRPPPDIGLFIASGNPRLVEPLNHGAKGRISRYRIEHLVRVTGEIAEEIAPGWTLVRMLGPGPIDLAPLMGATVFAGVPQHLHYTDAGQRRELLDRSRPPVPASAETVAVLIPIRKSAAWWNLAQDERQLNFQRSAGHTAIGMRYVERIHRSLFHSRYLGVPSRYDFITYFEFQRDEAPEFRRLLEELRDRQRNPEWSYVDLEFEIWMTKLE